MADMEISLVSCWYKEKSCGNFAYNLSRALDKLGVKVSILSANCLCHRDDPFNPELFFSPCQKIKFADFYWKPFSNTANYFRIVPQLAGDAVKGRRYVNRNNVPLLNYQQTQGSFGFLPLLSFLSFPTEAKRVVTIHEIDSIQKQFKLKNIKLRTAGLNKIYNKADAVIVQNSAMKASMEKLGVHSEKIHIIPHGTYIPYLNSYDRDQIIFCGGHKIAKGKGFDIFLQALSILKSQGVVPKVVIYGLNLQYGQEEGKALVSKSGVGEQVKWFNYNFDEGPLFEEFQKSMLMVTPYTSSEAGAQVTAAMANAVPVIATRNVGLPEYLGEAGVYIRKNGPEDLAQKMKQLMNNADLRVTLGSELRKRALEQYSWDVIARKTFGLFKEIIGGDYAND